MTVDFLFSRTKTNYSDAMCLYVSVQSLKETGVTLLYEYFLSLPYGMKWSSQVDLMPL